VGVVQPLDRTRHEQDSSRLRLHTLVRLRWFAVVGQLVTVAIVSFALAYPMPLGGALLLIALSAWVNVYLRVRFPARFRLSSSLATALLAYDIIQLAGLLYLTGGVQNPFAFLLVAPVTVSAATLPPRNTILLGLVATTSAALLVGFHYPLPWAPGFAFELPTVFKVGMLVSIVAGMTFLALYAFRLSKEARQMTAALSATELVLAREQRLHALDGLAAAAAHELGTPLGTIVLVSKELERDLPADSPFAEDIALLRTQAARCREILQKLTRRPTDQDPHHASLPVTQLLQEAAEPYRTAPNRITINSGPAQGLQGAGRYEPVGERRPGVIFGLGNIIENAVDFARERVDVDAAWTEREIIVTITDDGPGFPPEIMDTLGEPYVTTRPARDGRPGSEASGLGLGFFIAKTLLERSGAVVTLANREAPASGAIVRLVWLRSEFQGTLPQGLARETGGRGAADPAIAPAQSP
jgi:two-component system sensor histidine kinase RegB